MAKTSKQTEMKMKESVTDIQYAKKQVEKTPTPPPPAPIAPILQQANIPAQEKMQTETVTQAIVPLTREQKAVQTFKTQLSAYEKKVLPDLLSKHGINPSQFIQIVLSEIKKNAKLLEAFIVNPASMFASILAGAEIGLIPSDMLGEFYLIPRNVKQPDGRYLMTVCPQIGYKGLVGILLRSGDITRIHTEVVYEGDFFEAVYGLEPNIIHRPNFDVPRTAAKIKYAYAVAKTKLGEYQFAVMTRAEIETIQKIAPYENSLYFNDKIGINRWMERKLVLVQLGKMLPKDYYSKKAISMDSALQGGAYLTLEEGNQVKVIEGGNAIKQKSKGRDIYGTLANISYEDGDSNFIQDVTPE
jgi:recombination protein RecT